MPIITIKNEYYGRSCTTESCEYHNTDNELNCSYSNTGNECIHLPKKKKNKLYTQAELDKAVQEERGFFLNYISVMFKSTEEIVRRKGESNGE